MGPRSVGHFTLGDAEDLSHGLISGLRKVRQTMGGFSCESNRPDFFVDM